ncbi:hypothetical protein OQI89_03535 [Lentilactobacillus diolivorans]|uniref:hypothetical protein n=1 Tax=Lentilactobacillus diolivorans TaxID=179838 RepID=UPI002469C255|nr:hypothetical protein [Lentilactobacillus diolivorans]MDH5104920.1 hypothetical protein [Lentilactobacillus diolivorans]
MRQNNVLMNKLLLGMFLLLLSLVLLITVPGHVEAATWHRGAPRVLKGTWRTHLYRDTTSGGYYTRTTFGINGRSTGGLNVTYSKTKQVKMVGCGWGYNTKLHYRYLGHHRYYLRSYLNGRVTKRTRVNYIVHIVGKKRAYINLAAGRHLFYKTSNHIIH